MILHGCSQSRVCRETDRTKSDMELTELTATDLVQPRPGPGSTTILQSAEIPPTDFWRPSGLCGSVRLVKSVWTRPARPHNLPPRLDWDKIYAQTYTFYPKQPEPTDRTNRTPTIATEAEECSDGPVGCPVAMSCCETDRAETEATIPTS